MTVYLKKEKKNLSFVALSQFEPALKNAECEIVQKNKIKK